MRSLRSLTSPSLPSLAAVISLPNSSADKAVKREASSGLVDQTIEHKSFRDYDHHAMVATVKCQQGHQSTAWQVFLATGPLALLPQIGRASCRERV